MKKLLFVLVVSLLGTLAASAQDKVYCELVGSHKFLSTKMNVKIDFGQERKFFGDNRLTDKNGNVIEFNSMIDAMNYMAGLGWKFEQAYVVANVSSSKTDPAVSTLNTVHWILSKTLNAEAEDPLSTRQLDKDHPAGN